MFFLTHPSWIYVFTELVAVHSRILMETWNTNMMTTWVLLCCRTLDVILWDNVGHVWTDIFTTISKY